jgi:(E)-4-hydroxy-3-methylbut-2-enyl-diphosphate synthase
MHSNFSKLRRYAKAVDIGGIPLGSDFPVRIQSMANTLTSDTGASIQQCIRIINAGADYMRFTVPSLADVDSFARIKAGIREKGYDTPLIADVHFNPDIALKVVDYADKVRINPGNFTDQQKFEQLIEKCKNNKVAIRIGVNHGSLSPQIMNDFGDTPLGMAESAMEFLRICRKHNFNQVVVSMKASNVRVMVYATRLIADMMDIEGMPFPLHLGVTEAGDGDDGRIKSAAGIAALLNDGIGDTIRVSLTEDPEAEIPVARKIVNFSGKGSETVEAIGPVEYSKRKSRIAGNVGGNFPPVVIGFDAIQDSVNLVESSIPDLTREFLRDLSNNRGSVLVLNPGIENSSDIIRRVRTMMEMNYCDVPVVLRLHTEEKSVEDFMLKSAACLAGAFIDGFGDGLWLSNQFPMPAGTETSVSLGILQATRARMSKTEYISCPSCGRTNFNLMESLSRIKAATVHLKGLKIGVMGCIVNGPGEMADADYGYVGAGKGKITLYKGREVVKRNIPETEAVEELIRVIKDNGDWKEPNGEWL